MRCPSRSTTFNEQAEIAKGELMAAEAAVAEAQGRADSATAEAERNLEQLRDFSVDAYVQGNGDPTMDALFTENGNDASEGPGLPQGHHGQPVRRHRGRRGDPRGGRTGEGQPH